MFTVQNGDCTLVARIDGPDAGHLPYVEKPQEVAALITAFMEN